jgi:uncharacterized protein (TIGR02646 family)
VIKVPRTVGAPKELTTLGAAELQKTLEHYSNAQAKSTPFGDYKAYKHPSVKAALNALFRNKCAYCEMDYGGAPLDVEHFRPKSAVVELDPLTFKILTKPATVKPAYFWLAAEWTNLLPSCIDCNRPRTQEFPDAEDAVSGKSNYFPVVTGTARSLDPKADSESNEKRLLLDPCRDDPQQHLEFSRKGTIRAKDTPTGPDPMGLASIEVYGLQRDPLVRKREATQTALRLRMFDVKRAARRLIINPQDKDAKGALKRGIAEIEKVYLADDKPFLAMCRQTVREGLASGPRAQPVLAQAGQGQLGQVVVGVGANPG